MNFLITIKNDFLSFQKLSKNVEVKKKKLRIFISVLLRNLASLCEILIVVLFSFILTGEMPSDTFLENINLNNFTYFIPQHFWKLLFR